MTREGPGADAQPKGKKRPPDWLLFLSKFFRHRKAMASLVPSSPYLSRGFISAIDWARCGCVVELGAGTGPVTVEILRQAPATCRVIILERDPDFCSRLRERFPGADVAQADANDLERVLDERGIERVDHFLCGLPLPSFPGPSKERILDVVFRKLAPDGTFRQLTHVPYVYYRMYRRYFHEVRFHLVFRNLPPGGYYTCRRPIVRDSSPSR